MDVQYPDGDFTEIISFNSHNNPLKGSINDGGSVSERSKPSYHYYNLLYTAGKTEAQNSKINLHAFTKLTNNEAKLRMHLF